MFKRKIFFYAIIIITLFLIIACNTAARKEESALPDWVRTRPVDSEYFIGIGFSNTSIDDAKQNAFFDLVSVILDKIKTSQQALLPPDAESIYFASADAHIAQSLSRNSVEISSDFYHSRSRGHWVYYRILKADWERIEREDREEIADFLTEVLSPRFSSRETTTYELLSSLGNGWKFIAESPYPMVVLGSLNNERGLFINLIENSISKVLSRLEINLETDHVVTEPDRSNNFVISLLDRDGRRPGELQINFYNKANEEKIAQVITDRSGRYSGKVEFRNLPFGDQRVYAEISMPYLEIDPEPFKTTITIPLKEFTVTVNEISVVLKLIINGEAEIERFIDRTKALFSREELAIRLSPGNMGERYTILFTINFRNQPATAHDLFITNANATVMLFQEDRNLFSYTTQEYREVGLDSNLAQERVAIKMFNDISNDELFFQELHKAIYVGTIFE